MPKACVSVVSRLLLLLCLSIAGCGGSNEQFLTEEVVTLDSVAVRPQEVAVGGGFSIPFNQEFNFQTARETDPKTAQVTIVGSFSNGTFLELPISKDTVFFSPSNEKFSISSSGLLSTGALEVCGDSSEVTAIYRFGEVRRSDTFTVSTACLVATAGAGGMRAEPFIPRGGIYNEGFVAQFRGPDRVDLILTGDELTYSLKEEVTGVTVASESGLVRVEDTVPIGRRLIVLVSYQDPQTGLTLRSEVEFEVIE
jgi:hypothetical protein